LKARVYYLAGFLYLAFSAVGYAELHGSMTATSNYVSRAYSKSNDRFAFQGNLDYQHEKGAYLGTSISTVNFADTAFDNPARVEIIPYLGWSFSLSDDWRMDLQWSRYLYDGNVFGKSSDYNEYYLFLHYRDLLSVNFSASEDYYNRGQRAENYEIIGRYPITDYLQVSGALGYMYTKKAVEDNYYYWNAGFTFFYKFATLDFRYVDAHEEEHHDEFATHDPYLMDLLLVEPSFLFTISLGF
jgi:uncharacterized protein (TIGR02001 family)